jgi:hypothetical protein
VHSNVVTSFVFLGCHTSGAGACRDRHTLSITCALVMQFVFCDACCAWRFGAGAHQCLSTIAGPTSKRRTYSFPCGHVHWLCNSFFVMHVTRSLAILLRGAGRRFAWRSCERWRPLRILGSQRLLEAKYPRAPREALLLQGALCLWLRRSGPGA